MTSNYSATICSRKKMAQLLHAKAERQKRQKRDSERHSRTRSVQLRCEPRQEAREREREGRKKIASCVKDRSST